MSKKIFFMIFTVVSLILVECFIFYSGRIGPRDKTLTRMLRIAYAIDNYCQENKRLPQNITVLNKYGIDRTSSFDGWDNSFDFEVIEPNLVVLRSLGQDKKVGGEGENKDFIIKYNSERRFIDRDGLPFIIDVNTYLGINSSGIENIYKED